MKIYNYHPQYKYYLNCDDADESPLEPGVYHIPAHSTVIEPPECGESEIQVFNGISWDVLDDYRGIYYNQNTLEPFEWFEPFEKPLNSTKKVPPNIESGYILKWENDKWVILEDMRGIYYSIQTMQEIHNFDPFNYPPNSTKEPPPQVSDGYAIMWDDGWKVIEIPPPVELTPEEKLAQAGLTIEELKKLLGLS